MSEVGFGNVAGMGAGAGTDAAPKRKRVRAATGEQIGAAIQQVGAALAPLRPEQRGRVLRAVAVLFDLPPPELPPAA